MRRGGGKANERGSKTSAGSATEARSDDLAVVAVDGAARTDRKRAAASREVAPPTETGASPAHIPIRIKSAATGPLRTPSSMFFAVFTITMWTLWQDSAAELAQVFYSCQ